MADTTPHYDRVRAFMEKTRGPEDPIPSVPAIPRNRRLRAAMILEEAIETVRALGFDFLEVCHFGEPDLVVGKKRIKFYDVFKPDLVELADGCADLSVVVIGTLIAAGIRDVPLLEEVDAANAKKVAGKLITREDGKILKPKGWKGPNVKKVLEEQR